MVSFNCQPLYVPLNAKYTSFYTTSCMVGRVRSLILQEERDDKILICEMGRGGIMTCLLGFILGNVFSGGVYYCCLSFFFRKKVMEDYSVMPDDICCCQCMDTVLTTGTIKSIFTVIIIYFTYLILVVKFNIQCVFPAATINCITH